VKPLPLFVLAAGALCAQDASVSLKTAVDINGRRVVEGPQTFESKSGKSVEITERARSINGRNVPLERVEERVLRDDASGRLIERLIRPYDPNGNPAPLVKEVIEERKGSDGGGSVLRSTYRGDINGGFQLAERASTETRKNGGAETSDTVIERPGINGSLEPVSKVASVKVTQPDGYDEESTTYRKDGGGGYYAAVRRTTQHKQNGAQSTDNSAEYEVGFTGRLELHSQSVKAATKLAGGGEEVQVDLYAREAPGTVGSSGERMKVKEQQLIERRKTGTDTVVETLSVRRPSVSDPGRLGPSRQISETVCTGKCGAGAP